MVHKFCRLYFESNRSTQHFKSTSLLHILNYCRGIYFPLWEELVIGSDFFQMWEGPVMWSDFFFKCGNGLLRDFLQMWEEFVMWSDVLQMWEGLVIWSDFFANVGGACFLKRFFANVGGLGLVMFIVDIVNACFEWLIQFVCALETVNSINCGFISVWLHVDTLELGFCGLWTITFCWNVSRMYAWSANATHVCLVHECHACMLGPRVPRVYAWSASAMRVCLVRDCHACMLGPRVPRMYAWSMSATRVCLVRECHACMLGPRVPRMYAWSMSATRVCLVRECHACMLGPLVCVIGLRVHVEFCWKRNKMIFVSSTKNYLILAAVFVIRPCYTYTTVDDQWRANS